MPSLPGTSDADLVNRVIELNRKNVESLDMSQADALKKAVSQVVREEVELRLSELNDLVMLIASLLDTFLTATSDLSAAVDSTALALDAVTDIATTHLVAPFAQLSQTVTPLTGTSRKSPRTQREATNDAPTVSALLAAVQKARSYDESQ